MNNGNEKRKSYSYTYHIRLLNPGTYFITSVFQFVSYIITYFLILLIYRNTINQYSKDRYLLCRIADKYLSKKNMF